MRVAQTVNLDPRKAGGADVLTQKLRDAVGMQGLAVDAAEDEVLIPVARAEQLLVLLLSLTVQP